MIFFVPKQLKIKTVTAYIVTMVYITNFILYKKLTLLASFILFFRSPISILNLCILFTLEYILYPKVIKLIIKENLLLSIIANIDAIIFKNNSHEKYFLYELFIYLLYSHSLKPLLKIHLFFEIRLFL